MDFWFEVIQWPQVYVLQNLYFFGHVWKLKLFKNYCSNQVILNFPLSPAMTHFKSCIWNTPLNVIHCHRDRVLGTDAGEFKTHLCHLAACALNKLHILSDLQFSHLQNGLTAFGEYLGLIRAVNTTIQFFNLKLWSYPWLSPFLIVTIFRSAALTVL